MGEFIPGIWDFYPGNWGFLSPGIRDFVKSGDFHPRELGIFIPGDWGFLSRELGIFGGFLSPGFFEDWDLFSLDGDIPQKSQL